MRNKKFKITGVFLAIALSFAAIASAEGVRKRLKFARGKTATSVSGTVIRGDRDTYIIGGREGQKMNVRVTALEKNAVFQIKAPGGDFLSGAGEMDDATNWNDTLPTTGDYEIMVGGTRGNAGYKLTVSIK